MECSNPQVINGLIVPCKKCFACRCAARYAWAFRLYQEFKHSQSAYFVTLTYNDDNVPTDVYYKVIDTKYYTLVDKKTGEIKDCKRNIYALETSRSVIFRKHKKYELRHNITNFDSLNRFHATDFLKKVQKYCKRVYSHLCRYYLIGEYGDSDSHRPHYHSLMFFKDVINLEQCENIVKDCWNYGNIVVKSVNFSNINYVGKHQIKECRGNYYQQKESPIFAKMSRYGGGVGKDYLTAATSAFHYSDKDNNSYVLSFGFKIPLPPFYRKKLWTENLTEEELQELTAKMYDKYKRLADFEKTDIKGVLKMSSSLVRDAEIRHERMKFTKRYLQQKILNKKYGIS